MQLRCSLRDCFRKYGFHCQLAVNSPSAIWPVIFEFRLCSSSGVENLFQCSTEFGSEMIKKPLIHRNSSPYQSVSPRVVFRQWNGLTWIHLCRFLLQRRFVLRVYFECAWTAWDSAVTHPIRGETRFRPETRCNLTWGKTGTGTVVRRVQEAIQRTIVPWLRVGRYGDDETQMGLVYNFTIADPGTHCDQKDAGRVGRDDRVRERDYRFW